MAEILRFPFRPRPVTSDNLTGFECLGALGPFGDELPGCGELVQLRPETEAPRAGGELSIPVYPAPPGGGPVFPASPPNSSRRGGRDGAAASAHAVRKASVSWAEVTGEAAACVYHLVNLCNSISALLHLALRFAAAKVAAGAGPVIRYGRKK